MANTTITNTGVSVIAGNLALVGPSATGMGGVVTGRSDIGNAAAARAEADVLRAHHDATGAGPPVTEMSGVDLGGRTLGPGIYHFGSSAALHGTLTLDGEGASNPTFIFQIGSTLTTGTGARVRLTNGADGCAVFWAVGSSATIGTAHLAAGQPDGTGQHHDDDRCDHRRRRGPEWRSSIRSERRDHPRHQHDHRAHWQLQRTRPDSEADAQADAQADAGPDRCPDRPSDARADRGSHADPDPGADPEPHPEGDADPNAIPASRCDP